MSTDIYTREECKKLIDELKVIKQNKTRINIISTRITNELKESILFHTVNCRDDLSERIYWILNDIEDYLLCEECGKQFQPRFYGLKHGYWSKRFCSLRCASVNESVLEKTKSTCIKKYNVEYIAQVPEFKSKIQTTSEERYGFKNVMQSPIIQEKSRQTCKEKYDVEYVFQSDMFKEKSKQTHLERLNVENPSQSPIIKEKKKQTCLKNHGVEYSLQSPIIREKYKQTCLENLGYEFPAQSLKVREKMQLSCLENHGVRFAQQSLLIQEKTKLTNLERFGKEFASQAEDKKLKSIETSYQKFSVANVMHNPEYFLKCQQNSFSRKKLTLPSSKEVTYQGYEDVAIFKLLKDGYLEEQIVLTTNLIPQIKYQFSDKDKTYYPDIFIPSENKIIEVKSTWTYEKDLEKNLAKRQACIDQGYLFEFWICSDKELLQII